jgi:hypothetical protein
MGKKAKVADGWMSYVFVITSIYHGSSKSGPLDTTKIIQPEGMCQKPDVHPAAQKLADITDYKLDQCNLCNNCQIHGCSDYCLCHQKSQKNTKDNGNESKTGKPWVYAIPCILVSKKHKMHGSNISLSVTGL